jgi:hypothetical protein
MIVSIPWASGRREASRRDAPLDWSYRRNCGWLDLLPYEIVGGWIFFAPLDWSYRRNCGWLDLLPAEIVGGWIFFCGWLDLLIFQVGAWIFLAVPISP